MSAETREKLLQVAEKLIAENGIGNTSLRSIVSKAGVNIAAVNYHFGSKEELVLAVYRQYFEPVNRERMTRLDLLEQQAADKPIPLEELLKAFILPVVAIHERVPESKRHVIQLFGRIHMEAPELRIKIVGSFRDVLERFVQAFHRILPQLSLEEVALRMQFSMGCMMAISMAPPEIESMMTKNQSKPDADFIARQMLAFAVSGFQAPTQKSKGNPL